MRALYKKIAAHIYFHLARDRFLFSWANGGIGLGFFSQKSPPSLLQYFFSDNSAEGREFAVALKIVTRKIFLVLSVCLGVLFSRSSCAQQSVDIYRVEAAVTNQTEEERVAAAQANLGNVIALVLRNPAGLQHPMVQQAIKDAPNYLAKFSYSSEKIIVLNYSPKAIQTLLQQAQLIAATATSTQSVTLTVADVKDFSSFKQVQAYLSTVGVIRNFTLMSVDRDVLEFTLSLDGDEQLLKTSLGASNKLHHVAGDAQHPLSFRWQN